MTKKKRRKSPASRQQVQAEPHERQASGQEAQPQDHGPAPVNAPIAVREFEASKAPHRKGSRYKEAQPSEKSSDRWMTRFTGLIVLFTAITAGLAGFQWRATERAIDESKISRELDSRAWVTIREATFTNTILSRQPLNPAILFNNSGKTPALKFTIHGTVEVRHSSKAPDEHSPIPSFGKPPDRSVFGPNSEIKQSLSGVKGLNGVTTALLSDVDRAMLTTNTGHHIYVWGRLDYEDIFGRPHFTRFCLYTYAPDSTDLSPCPRGNFIDEERGQ